MNFNLKHRKYHCSKGTLHKINKYMLVFSVPSVDMDDSFRDDENENRNCPSKKHILIYIKFYQQIFIFIDYFKHNIIRMIYPLDVFPK